MRIAALFPHLAGFRVKVVRLDDGQLILAVAARRQTASCPYCRRRSRRVHSRYRRSPSDLPINGLHVALQVQVRRFFCVNPCCPHRTFAERFPTLVADCSIISAWQSVVIPCSRAFALSALRIDRRRAS
ncbi:MAG: transposase family protein [Thermomicrobia bacterium]|nr:transposase family protein [Thermomicrobia bacterium]